MKKIIALAVASAFVAPVYAADVSLSGDMAFHYSDEDGSDNKIKNDTTVITVSGSGELNNGWSVSGDMPILLDGSGSDGGESIKLSGNGVVIDFGDVSGALDAVGDYTDISPEEGGFAGDGNDAGLSVSTSLAGAKLTVSHSPKGGVDGGAADFNSYSVAAGVGPAEFYVGAETHGDDANDVIAYGVKATFNGIMVAYEYANYDAGHSATGMAVKYGMGDLSLGLEAQNEESAAGVDTADQTIMFVAYDLGDGASVFFETSSDDSVGGVDENVLGLKFSF